VSAADNLFKDASKFVVALLGCMEPEGQHVDPKLVLLALLYEETACLNEVRDLLEILGVEPASILRESEAEQAVCRLNEDLLV
jgi:hypothetical protein